jgi:tol-pal system protein YbgF
MLEQEPALALPGQAALTLALAPTRARRVVRFLALVWFLGGCSTVADVTGTATQDDMTQLRADVTALQLNLQRFRADVDRQMSQVDPHARDQARETQRQLEELARRLDGLATTMTTLTTRVDQMAGRVDALSRRAAAPGTPSPAPATPAPAPATPRAASPAPPAPASPAPQRPVTAAPSVAPAAPPPTATPSAPPARTTPTTGPIQPQDIYQTAYLDFSKGSYQRAIDGFREFLRRFPDHELAGSAQYWIGEAYFSLARTETTAGQNDRAKGLLEQAVQEYRKVIANYPRGDKAPTALYKEALALIELKQPALAQQRLQYLIENFPQAEETPLAREKLASLKSG